MHIDIDFQAIKSNKELLTIHPRTFWANAGLGAASAPNYWQVFHDGDCTVHKSEIETLTGGNLVTLLNGTKFQTDYIILCTGFDKSYHQFSPELQQELGLVPDSGAKEQVKWAKLEADAELVVDDLLPALKDSPFAASRDEPHFSDQLENLSSSSSSSSSSSPSHGGNMKEIHGPSRHYRRLVVPRLAAQGDRSVYFPGFIHTIYTPLVSEVQALWGVAFMQGLLDDSMPPQRAMEREVAEWNVWTRKRYGAQGRKHAYAIYDFLSVSLCV
jgi:dimethylaniline monooxygenase (N-oxide forming)